MKWELGDEDGPNCEEYNTVSNLNRGIVLVVGFVPGLKVAAVPLIRPKKVCKFSLIWYNDMTMQFLCVLYTRMLSILFLK